MGTFADPTTRGIKQPMSESSRTDPPSVDAEAVAARQHRTALVFVLAAVGLTSVQMARESPMLTASGPSPRWSSALVALDPNTAEWFELAQLPGLGESDARRIVAHRQRSMASRRGEEYVFLAPGDLNLVPGIGRRTVQRTRPFLRFEMSDHRD